MRILAIDLGDVRSGVAISDVSETLASPVCTINESDRAKLLEEVINLIKKYNVRKVVIGLPKNMDGTEGKSAQKSHEFAENIKSKVDVEIVMQDERCTTKEANMYLNVTDARGKKRKKVIDSVAATIILQNYLDSAK